MTSFGQHLTSFGQNLTSFGQNLMSFRQFWMTSVTSEPPLTARSELGHFQKCLTNFVMTTAIGHGHFLAQKCQCRRSATFLDRDRQLATFLAAIVNRPLSKVREGTGFLFRTTSDTILIGYGPEWCTSLSDNKIYLNQEHMLATQCLEEEEVTILECCGLPAAKVIKTR